MKLCLLKLYTPGGVWGLVLCWAGPEHVGKNRELGVLAEAPSPIDCVALRESVSLFGPQFTCLTDGKNTSSASPQDQHGYPNELMSKRALKMSMAT